MTIEISKEEFLKRYKERYSESYEESNWFWNGERIYADVQKTCEYLNLVLLDRSGWEKLKEIVEEIVWLYKEYGMADDSMLTKYAQYLKERILEVKDDFKLEELQRIVEGKKE